MANAYAKVRRKWKEIQTEQDLKAIWRGERFESDDSVEEALRVYEMAIRVDGWEQVRDWARDALKEDQILHAQLVELAMRCTEQKDAGFFEEITDYLLGNSPPNYFRFWFALFSTRHSHFGEVLFRKQLAELSDFHIVKYRRWLHKILRKLRFRCHSAKEKALGAIAFAMYSTYDPKAYPSELFDALIACHNTAKNPQKKKSSAKPVSKQKQMVAFSAAAAKLGIWSLTEGIRTSHQLPRTIGYLAAMAPCMSNTEVLRALRAFDLNLKTASHKKASSEVVELAAYIKGRLEAMELPTEEWCKIYPYLTSPALIQVFEDLIEEQVDARTEEHAKAMGWSPLALVPQGLGPRHFRIAQVAGYLLYLQDPEAGLYQLYPGQNHLLSQPSPLWPKGWNRMPMVSDWAPRYLRKHAALFGLIRGTFPDAAARKSTEHADENAYLSALRYRLYQRDLLDGESSSRDVPVLFLSQQPSAVARRALQAYLPLFPAAVLVLFQREWDEPLVGLEHVEHLSQPHSVQELLEQLGGLQKQIARSQKAFKKRKREVDHALRQLRLGPPPTVYHIPQ